MGKMARSLLLLLLSSGCMFEVHSVGSGNGDLEGSGGAGRAGSAATGGVGGAGGIGGAGGVAGTGGVVVAPPACTPGTERTDCPGTSCEPATMQCSTFKLASRAACWTCVSDNDCKTPDHRCVEMYFDGERFPDEKHGFCLRVAVLTADDPSEHDCGWPFGILLRDRPSLSGVPTNSYCGLQEDLTTCYALRSFENQEQCPDGSDEECPAGGICRTFEHDGAEINCCTYACTDDDECPALDGGNPTCGGYCGG
jgi:hypothetical protein